MAGRVMLVRPQGKLAFAELRDATGSVQLFALEKTTAGFEAFARLSLGDWVGAPGRSSRPAGASRRSRSPSGACWPRPAAASATSGRGVSDIETRFRQREVDLWANERSRQILLLRSAPGAAPA